MIRQHRSTILLVLTMLLLSAAFLIWGLATPQDGAACNLAVATSCP